MTKKMIIANTLLGVLINFLMHFSRKSVLRDKAKIPINLIAPLQGF